MSFLFSNRAISALGVGVVLSRRRMKREDVEAKTGMNYQTDVNHRVDNDLKVGHSGIFSKF